VTRDEFWSIVERSRQGWDTTRGDGNQDRQLHDLEELLSRLPAKEVASFNGHLGDVFHAAYRWDLWDAAGLIGEGCSDDGFMDFRGWLISMGRSVYERALADPESLAEIAHMPGVECIFFEGFMAVPKTVYEQHTGRELDSSPWPDKPAGQRTREAELPRRFPILWKKFGDR
jgi:Protein of unknown function (DUF4240)